MFNRKNTNRNRKSPIEARAFIYLNIFSTSCLYIQLRAGQQRIESVQKI